MLTSPFSNEEDEFANMLNGALADAEEDVAEEEKAEPQTGGASADDNLFTVPRSLKRDRPGEPATLAYSLLSSHAMS